MRTVINDMLDFSRIEDRQLQLDPVKFLLRESLGDAMGTLTMRAEQKELELACHISVDTPNELIGDASSSSFCRSEEHTSELQSHLNLVCRLLLEKKKKIR